MPETDATPHTPPTAEETAKLVAETNEIAVNIRLKEAEITERLAKANFAESEAAVGKIQLAREVRKDQAELALDFYHKVYNFGTAVTESSTKACMNQLTQWMRNDPACEIEIVFNSPGGSIVDGMALWDFIQMVRAKGHKVTTSTIGMAASMAGILLQAGDVRIMGRQSWLMIHEASFGAMGKIGEVEDTVEWVKRMQDRILDIFSERSTLTKKQLATRWKRTNWWISSDEALELGLVDEVR